MVVSNSLWSLLDVESEKETLLRREGRDEKQGTLLTPYPHPVSEEKV